MSDARRLGTGGWGPRVSSSRERPRGRVAPPGPPEGLKATGTLTAKACGAPDRPYKLLAVPAAWPKPSDK